MVGNSFQHESQTACCVAGDHLINRSADQSLTSYQAIGGPYGILGESAVNVDISDLDGNEEAMLLTHCLNYCHRVVLKPLTYLLLLVGWRPFFYGALVRYPRFWKLLNKLYPLLVFCLMVFYDAMLIATCEGKLEDRGKVWKRVLDAFELKKIFSDEHNKSTYDAQNHTHRNESLAGTEGHNLGGMSGPPTASDEMLNCHHIIPIYIVPGILHMVTYIYGFFHYRIQEHEQIYSLMEKVFIRSQTSWGVQLTLVKNSRALLFTVLFWMFLNVGMEILYNFSFVNEPKIFLTTFYWSRSCAIFLYVLRTLGFLLLMIMQVVVLFNYSSQCEMLIMYINGLVMSLREKSLLLKEALHEILGVREYITVLNGAMGKITAICMLNYMQLLIIGLCFLNPFTKEDTDTEWKAEHWTYRVAFPLVWLYSIAVPLVQGARLTKAGQMVRQVSFEMKVFGYHNSNNLELDSFVLFVNNAALRAKLFGVIMRPAVLLLVMGGTALFIVLFLIIQCTSSKNFAKLF